MSRLVPYTPFGGKVATAAAADPGGGPSPTKDRIEAVSKYVPAEILAFYIPAVPAINLLQHAEWIPALQWVAFAVSWLLVPIYFRWVAAGDPRGGLQALVSSVAFPVWAYATNKAVGPLAPWYDEAAALLLLLVFSLVSAFLLPKRPPGEK
ncbi:MAG TPA: hypothetical protein VFI87_05715 [Hyphomicrobiaceae bacterium]|nr:hypothetical protein [Hyphomicrobiaceae bacterium]